MIRRLRWILLLALLGLGAWYWFAPRRAYHRFLNAIAFGDAAGLEATVDFPLLRMNLREDLRAGLERKAGTGLGAAVAGGVLGALVDAAVSPEGLSQIVTGFGMRDPGDAAADSLTAGAITSFHYRAPSRVDVVLYPEGKTADDGGILTFTRSGLRWKLTRAWSTRLASGANNR